MLVYNLPTPKQGLDEILRMRYELASKRKNVQLDYEEMDWLEWADLYLLEYGE